MKKNMGTVDKSLRVLIAILIAVLYFTNVISGLVATILLIFSAIFILTSLVGFCPLYTLLGVSTCKTKE